MMLEHYAVDGSSAGAQINLLRSSGRSRFQRSPVAVVVAVAVMVFCGACGRGNDDSSVARTRGELTSTDGSTGVPECDSYLDQYERCMQSTLTQSVFSQHIQGIRRQRSAWATLAETPFKKQSLARVCRAAIGTAREEFPSCSWSG